MTAAEIYLWLRIKNKKLGIRFLRQYSVKYYVLDFYSPEIKLAIEVDGITHLTKDELEYDNKRQFEIEQTGIRFIRFTNSEIYHDMENVILKISDKIKTLSAQ